MNEKRKRALPTSDHNNAQYANHTHLYFITILSGITSIISGFNISGLWTGITALLSAAITLALIYTYTGGFDDDGI